MICIGIGVKKLFSVFSVQNFQMGKYVENKVTIL